MCGMPTSTFLNRERGYHLHLFKRVGWQAHHHSLKKEYVALHPLKEKVRMGCPSPHP